MTRGVHSFADIPLLYGLEPNMGFTHKKTPERLDKIIQFIWLYQREHGGDSPTRAAIANELGTHQSSMAHFIPMLEDAKRLEKISSRPFRLRILEHPMNRAAIRRLEKALAAAAAIERDATPQPETPAEPEPGPELPAPIADLPPTLAPTPEVKLATAHRAFADSIDPAPVQRTAGMNYAEAKAIIAQHGGDLDLIAGLYILNTAKPGDLLEQLLERGYTVAKTNPKWR